MILICKFLCSDSMKRFQSEISSQNRDEISTRVKVKLNWDSTVFKQDFQLGTFEVLRKGFLELCKKNKGPLTESEGAHITIFNINRNSDFLKNPGQYNFGMDWYVLSIVSLGQILYLWSRNIFCWKILVKIPFSGIAGQNIYQVDFPAIGRSVWKQPSL